MTSKLHGRILLGSIAALCLFFVLSRVSQPDTALGDGKTFALQPPGFVGNAQASTADFDIAARLDEEAGISAWFKSPDAISLNQVRSQFRTIELETVNYIVGSVPVAGYLETADSHVYVHRDGWILAYYLRGDPVSKIIDARAISITTSKLKSVVAAVASAAGASFTDVTYYDFLYPNATNMLLVAEDLGNGNDFTIQLPSTYGYFERGWSLIDFGWPSYFQLDGNNLSPTGSDAGNVAYGSITAAQLLPDVTHTVRVDDWGAMVILYRVP